MKVALVTGGSRGIGKAIVKALSAEGFHVIINYRTQVQEAEQVLEELRQQDGSAELLPFDVSDMQACELALSHWKLQNPERFIHTIVNNAGIRKDNLMVFMDSNDWNNVLNTNLNSFYYITKPLLQDMIVNKGGRVINVVSLSGIKGMPGQTNYSAAKGGVIAATKALAQEIGRKNVTVNAVAPGFISTDMTEDLDEKEYKKLIPMNRFGRPEEVAEVVRFLASDRASYITGEVISVNGGLYT